MHSTGRGIVAQAGRIKGGLWVRKDYATATAAACPHLMEANEPAANNEIEWEKAVPYEKIPGPRAIPILGNTFR